MIFILMFILLLLLVIVGKKRGFKTFILFIGNLLLIILYIWLLGMGINAVVLALIICFLVTIVTLFGLNGYNVKTKSAFLGVMIILVIMGTLTIFITLLSNVQGFSAEYLESIGGFSFDINYDMTSVMIGMYLVAAIGTVIDTSISISSAMNEVYENNITISEKDLFISGMNIGKDILSTTVNTLFFAVISYFIGFFMWHKMSSIGFIINYKAFAQEVIKLLICLLGSILIIPVTSFISSKLISRQDMYDKYR